MEIAISREVFRPVFRAGAGRLTVMSAGSDREDATYDAIAKFLAKANCDFIVCVSTVAVKKIHPTPWWYFWRNSNYSVTISGIPVYLEKLSCETLAPAKVEAYDGASGLFLPARGYTASPVKAFRLNPPMPKELPKNHPVPLQIGTAPTKAGKTGAEAGVSSLLSL